MMRLPHPKAYHYFPSTLISSLLTYKFASYFLATVPSLHLLYCLSHAHADREIRFQIQILLELGCFPVYYGVHSSLLLFVYFA